MCIRQPCALGGSGSVYLYGFVDANFKPNMSKEQSEAFVTAGNFLNLVVISLLATFHK